MNGDEIVSFPQRGGEASHLTYEEMEAWLDGRADRTERELAEGHVALCPRCAAEVDDLRRVRESMAPKRRWWIAAAAAAAIVIAIVLAMWPQQKGAPEPVIATAQPQPPVEAPAPSPTPAIAAPAPRTLTKPAILATLISAPGTLRGTAGTPKLRLAAPVATVVLDPRPQFRWTAADGASEYTVAVADHATGADAASGSTTSTSWQPDAPLQRGRTYTWQVTAHIGDDRFTVPQPSDREALFHVATAATAKEIKALPRERHLERGIALAERGALDEAERELKRAAEGGSSEAGQLLTEVRSWRHQ